MKLLKGVLRIKDRDIIRVRLSDGKLQPFYKSSGRNSGMKGRWLPFDGVLCFEGRPLWFDKGRFASPSFTRLHRFGTQELKDISDKLGQMDIPEGEETDCLEINNWLGYKR